jgi:hypothetical protein
VNVIADGGHKDLARFRVRNVSAPHQVVKQPWTVKGSDGGRDVLAL